MIPRNGGAEWKCAELPKKARRPSGGELPEGLMSNQDALSFRVGPMEVVGVHEGASLAGNESSDVMSTSSSGVGRSSSGGGGLTGVHGVGLPMSHPRRLVQKVRTMVIPFNCKGAFASESRSARIFCDNAAAARGEPRRRDWAPVRQGQKQLGAMPMPFLSHDGEDDDHSLRKPFSGHKI
jgi:hypothetical protein